MGFQEILQEHDGRQARRFLTAPLPEGVDDKDTEDFAAFDIGHACGKARRRTIVLARGLSRRPPAAGTYIRFGTGDVSQKVPEFASEEGPGPGLAPRESVWSVSRNSLESDFNLAVIRGPGSGLQKGETPRSEKVQEGNSPRNPE